MQTWQDFQSPDLSFENPHPTVLLLYVLYFWTGLLRKFSGAPDTPVLISDKGLSIKDVGNWEGGRGQKLIKIVDR